METITDTSVESSSNNSKTIKYEDDRISGDDDGSIAENSIISDIEDGCDTDQGTTGPTGNGNDDHGFIRTLIVSRLCFLILVLITASVAATVTYLVASKNQDEAGQSQVRNASLYTGTTVYFWSLSLFVMFIHFTFRLGCAIVVSALTETAIYASVM
jgi:hypothetical protein